MINYFLTKERRKEIIDESVQVDCEGNPDWDPDEYRKHLESLNNYELITLCCNP
jgi:hypothetical protein